MYPGQTPAQAFNLRNHIVTGKCNPICVQSEPELFRRKTLCDHLHIVFAVTAVVIFEPMIVVHQLGSQLMYTRGCRVKYIAELRHLCGIAAVLCRHTYILAAVHVMVCHKLIRISHNILKLEMRKLTGQPVLFKLLPEPLRLISTAPRHLNRCIAHVGYTRQRIRKAVGCLTVITQGIKLRSDFYAHRVPP